MLAALRFAAPAFFITILGVVLAMITRTHGIVISGTIVVIVLLGGWLADRAAKAALPANPARAVTLFWLWGAFPGVFAAVAIAAIIYLNTTFDPDALGMTNIDKEMMKTCLTALTGLLTALCIKALDTLDEQLIGDHVKEAFFTKFKDSNDAEIPAGAYPVIVGESPLTDPIFKQSIGDLNGWGGEARRARAKAIAAGLRDPAEIARVKEFRTLRQSTPAQTKAPSAPKA